MIKKIILSIVFSLMILANPVMAHPPSSIDLAFDQDEGTLHIDMKHLSRDHSRHYIRKTVITRNGVGVATKVNRKQTDPNDYSLDVPATAEIGDTFEVKAYCSEGGSKETTLEVSEMTEEEKLEQKEMQKAKEKKLNADPHAGGVDVYGSKAETHKSKASIYNSKVGTYSSKQGTYNSKGNIYDSKKTAQPKGSY